MIEHYPADKAQEFLLNRIEELKDEIETLYADYLILFWELHALNEHACTCRCKDDEYQGA